MSTKTHATGRKRNKLTAYVCDCGERFTRGRKVSKGIPPKCKMCTTKAAKLRAKAADYPSRPKHRLKKRERLIKKYGITPADYQKMLEQQGNVCGICKQSESEGHVNLAIDHDHVTGKVRGLLCQKCNRALGVFGDTPKLLRAAAGYLLRSHRNSWDGYFVEFARLAATRSKDPSSQVGAVIVKDKIILATGYNGFPRGVNDNVPERYERPAKYMWTVHAEENVIFHCIRMGIHGLEGATLYVTPFAPCVTCAKAIVSVGIKEVVVDSRVDNPRFAAEFAQANEILHQSGVVVRYPE